ncbi:hypothetical protein [Nocardia sp. NPDC050710]|uniref:hypothetical protein n=1 Tax=Nocardia sp. NPDC050710 TaxID=3157220 RepID=UPI003401EEED
MHDGESVVGRMAKVWNAAWVWRRRAAVILLAAGALAWAGEALAAEMVITTEPQWKYRPYPGSLTGYDVLMLRMIVASFVALVLLIGMISLQRGRRAGRMLVIAASALVLAGQVTAMVAYRLIADAPEVFDDEPSPVLLFRWNLMIFPVLVIVFLLGRCRADQFPAASSAA